MAMHVTAFGQTEDRLHQLEQAIRAQHLTVSFSLKGEDALIEKSEHITADVVVMLVQRPTALVVEAIRLLQLNRPMPVVLFADNTDEKLTDLVIKSGAASFVVDGFESSRLKNIIDTALLRHQEMQALKDELIRAKLTIVERKNIERAKGMLMKQKQMDEDQAYRTMRQAAMSQNKRMIDVANTIIDLADMFN